MNDTNESPQTREAPKTQKLSTVSLILTTMAAAIGVQSDKNRERDFNQSSIWPYITAGVLFTVIFVLALLVLVNQVVE